MDIKDVSVGSIYTMISRLVTLLCGFAVSIALARNLGPVLFGVYSVIVSVLVWVEHTVSMGIPSVYRKAISEDPRNIGPIMASLKRISIPYCLVVMAVFSLLSPLIALGMGDDDLTWLLVIASLDIPFFGLYSTYMSILNGRGRFLLQSLLVVVYTISRTALIVGVILLGYGVTAALLANAAGSLCGLVMALFLMRRMLADDSAAKDDGRKLADLRLYERMKTFGIPFSLNFLVGTIFIHMDIWLVKAFTEDREAVNASVGFYAVAYNLARIPFFVIGGISFTIFPAIAMAAFQNRRSDGRKQILNSLRMTMLLLMPMIAVVLATGDRMIPFLFSEAYLPSVEAFRILFVGISIFSVFQLFVTIMAADNRQMTSLAFTLVLVPVAVALHYFLIRAEGIGGAAWSTTLVSLAGMVGTGIYVRARFGPIIELKSVVRLGIASVAMYGLATIDVLYQLNLVVAYVLLCAAYGVLLLALREVDVQTVKDTTRSLLKPKRTL